MDDEARQRVLVGRARGAGLRADGFHLVELGRVLRAVERRRGLDAELVGAPERERADVANPREGVRVQGRNRPPLAGLRPDREGPRAEPAVTGAVDFVTDGERAVRITGGSALMPQVTALGCSLTCLVGAFAATAPEDLFGATVAALATFAVAGEDAALGAAGPGSFSWRFRDALAAIDAETLDARARVSVA